MAGYTKVFAKIPGDRIDAEDFNDEYLSLSAAFDATNGHNHDGTAGHGGLIPRISSAGGTNYVFANGTLNEIQMVVDVGGSPQTQLYLRDGVLVPNVNQDVDLGTATEAFGDAYIHQVIADQLTMPLGPTITSILDEDSMASNSASSLATQQSIRAFVTNSINAAPGILKQSVTVRRQTDLSLSGSYADYLTTNITVAEGSKIHVFVTVTATADVTAGAVLGRIFLNGSEMNPTVEDSYITQTLTAPTSAIAQTISFNDSSLALSAGTYIVSLRLREQGTEGIGTSARLIIFEEVA